MKKLAIVTTHPIQYYAPIFKLLHQRKNIQVNVFYTVGLKYNSTQHDPGFGKQVSWDVPVLEGYPYEWADNVSADPGTRSFKGIITPSLIAQIDKWRPDALLIIGWAYTSHLKMMRHYKNKLPIYFRGDSTILTEPGGLKKLAKFLFLKWVYHHVNFAFYVGVNNKAYFKKYGLNEKQLGFAPHAIDNERFYKSRRDEALQLRASLGISEGEILILFAGKFEPVKNIPLLLSAFIDLDKANVHLLLVGNGVDEQDIKTQAAESKMAGNIHFLDFKNQSFMPVLYQAADFFCLPSKSESWGLSINEAMACNCAILASDKVGCAADLVKSGQNGEIFKGDDLQSLLSCLQQLTLDKSCLVKFGEWSRLMIRDWNFTKIAEAIEIKVMNETN